MPTGEEEIKWVQGDGSHHNSFSELTEEILSECVWHYSQPCPSVDLLLSGADPGPWLATRFAEIRNSMNIEELVTHKENMQEQSVGTILLVLESIYAGITDTRVWHRGPV